jgi:hypothetical protein
MNINTERTMSKTSHGKATHPVTNEKAPAGMHWVRNILSGVWVLESETTPYTCSVQSETYWSS